MNEPNRISGLKTLRLSQAQTQEGVARLTGVSSGQIGNYESGGQWPRLNTAVRLAAALDVTLDELYRVLSQDRATAGEESEAPVAD
jgi:transcriptional regulator with XRE-family HTH domain